ncbi:nucleoside hydrolase [Nesterenkonia pannonica]|uniref:nucleoside hydrolase n=1 Tax=Nesterenkonia pannonica TaxID=1548602 RepID=UPI0021647327|nr:nucleoside hydrolase [Nesterenkonia pannonica]
MNDDRLYILDCDTGVDDAMAIGYLLAEAPQSFVGVTTVFGNVDVPQATTNTRALLELAGRSDIPVHAGAATSLDGVFQGSGHRVHGQNGIGGVEPPTPRSCSGEGETAPSYLVRMARENPGELVIIAVGPLTNLAIALSLDPEIAELLAEIVIMGGAVGHPGNATPAAEANIWHDPEAADRVLRSGARVRLVPLDATMQQRLTGSSKRNSLVRPACSRKPWARPPSTTWTSMQRCFLDGSVPCTTRWLPLLRWSRSSSPRKQRPPLKCSWRLALREDRRWQTSGASTKAPCTARGRPPPSCWRPTSISAIALSRRSSPYRDS